MAKIPVTREQSEHGTKLMESVKGLVVAIKAALADGWQIGTDLPVIVSSAFATMVQAVEHTPGLPAEAKEDLIAFGRSLTTGAWDVADIFVDQPGDQIAPKA